MKKIRKLAAVGACGLVMGIMMSVMAAPEATGRSYWCDQRIASMEKKAAQDYSKGRLSDEEFEKIQAEIAYHRELWGC